MYQKDIYLPLRKKVKSKPINMNDVDWEILDRKDLGIVRLCSGTTIAFKISEEKTTKGFIERFSNMHEKHSTSNKVFQKKKLFNM